MRKTRRERDSTKNLGEFHESDNRRYTNWVLRNSLRGSVVEVRADTQANDDTCPNDVVPNPCPLKPLVAGPRCFVLSRQPVTLKFSRSQPRA